MDPAHPFGGKTNVSLPPKALGGLKSTYRDQGDPPALHLWDEFVGHVGLLLDARADLDR